MAAKGQGTKELQNPMIAIENLEQLPLCHRVKIPPSYIDRQGHMNVSRYFAIYGRGAMAMMGLLGMTNRYVKEERSGNFVLRQVINYLAEAREGDTVAIRGRILGRSAKRLHKIYFMVNETTRVVASTSEVLTTHADLAKRKSSPFPPLLSANIDAKLSEFSKLAWDAPVCGILKP